MIIPFSPGSLVVVGKCHPLLVSLADRHYTRRTPGSKQCTRPGVNLCLITEDGKAGFVFWRPIPQIGRMDNLEAWECTLFRNEGRRLSSALIREAVDVLWRRWGWPPRDGLITAIGAEATRKRRSKSNKPGHCFVMAGWSPLPERGGKPWLKAPHPERETKS